MASNQRYYMGGHEVKPKSNRFALEHSSGIFPSVRRNFRIYNYGRVPVKAVAKYGTAAQWIGSVTGTTVEPGEEKILDMHNRPYYVTGVYLENENSKSRALVHVGYQGNRYSWYTHKERGWDLNIDINEVAKTLVEFGVGKIPVVGEFLAPLIGFFWPESEPSVWDQVKDQVEEMIDTKTNDVITGILGGNLRHLKERIHVLKMDLDRHKNVSGHFMNIAEDMIGFEHKFMFRNEDNARAGEINYLLLPMYSSLVTLRMTLHQFGILNHEQIGLSEENVQRLKDYSKRLIQGPDGAIKHITSVLNERINNQLNTCIPDHVYDALVTVRTYCGLNGTEYIAYWNHLLEHPESTTKPYNDAITYSTMFGCPTPIQARQMVLEEVQQPLQPKLINGKRNKITGIDVWIWRKNNRGAPPKIGGLKIYFENGDSHELGKWSAEKHYVEFKGAFCTRLSVWGNGALDYLEFALSDGRVVGYGTKNDARGVHTDFQLENHHIAGIYVGDDTAGLGGQAANISVAYQLTPKE
uniref:Juvenile hormone esterase-related protein n=1 Tax=Leptinotarsa decemlineata TaxID=7539 RepID=O44707_LEPDE|nr:juvenile hormone esterase-related protein [Leptinotarsa decemlineata]